MSYVDEWLTPEYIWKAAEVALGGRISVDPASEIQLDALNWNIPATAHYTQYQDGLSMAWHGTVFLNPPHSREANPGHWVDKAIMEYIVGNTTRTIMLLPARLETEWFRPCHYYPMIFLHKRVKYIPRYPDLQKDYGSGKFPSVIVSLGVSLYRLHGAFSHIGTIYTPYIGAEALSENDKRERLIRETKKLSKRIEARSLAEALAYMTED